MIKEKENKIKVEEVKTACCKLLCGEDVFKLCSLCLQVYQQKLAYHKIILSDYLAIQKLRQALKRYDR